MQFCGSIGGSHDAAHVSIAAVTNSLSSRSDELIIQFQNTESVSGAMQI